ncbi:hypothetical protein LCGC14_2157130 [marine sediment metagenome]|uniref:Uncharacterized protein n=1 Tax=marine sediment metagenome TaxID=412755 RepID=A0A0F9DTQ0_9ZZZZ
MSKKTSRKPTKTVKVTCKECGREIRVSKGSRCHREELCYACISNKVEERSDVKGVEESNDSTGKEKK